MNRRTKADDKKTDGGDVEAQTSPTESAPRTRPTNTPASGGGSFLRKLMMLTARDVTENNSSTGYLLTIIKDVIAGTLLGVFFLMILIFLDYRNIVQLGSARAFRRAAFELMTDPETVKTIEENIEIKFVPVTVHTSMTEEITRNRAKADNNDSIKQHEEDLVKRKAEVEGLRAEYDELMAKGTTVLGLDKWCGSCKGGWGNCDGRVKYLSDTYHTPDIKSRVDIMATGKCMN